jgi:hypothetical protein
MTTKHTMIIRSQDCVYTVDPAHFVGVVEAIAKRGRVVLPCGAWTNDLGVYCTSVLEHARARGQDVSWCLDINGEVGV